MAGPDLPAGGANMKNGLYSVHIQMGDGVKGRASGIIVLRDGIIVGGDLFLVDRHLHLQGKHSQGRHLEGRSGHQPAHALQNQPDEPVIWWPGGRVGLFWNIRGWRFRSFRHHAGGQSKSQFSGDIAPASGYLMASPSGRLYTARDRAGGFFWPARTRPHSRSSHSKQ
jgi:hypothetical protein